MVHGPGVLGALRPPRRVAEVDRIVRGRVLEVAEHEREHAVLTRRLGAIQRGLLEGDPPRREDVVRRLVIEHRQAHLLHVVEALGPAGRLARRLHRGQEQRRQHTDDRR